MGFLSSVGKSIGGALSGGTGISPDMFGSSSGDLMDMIPGIGDSRAAARQNAANQANAKTQMDFQERMSNSAYQRATEDMKKAGINPMLAFSQGGASTPSGALPTVNSETKSKLGEFAMSSALGVKNSATAQQQANTQQSSAESGIMLNKAAAAEKVANTANTQADTAIKNRELKGRRITETLDKAAGGVVQKIIDSMSNSARQSKIDKLNRDEPLIKVLGPGPKNFKFNKN